MCSCVLGIRDRPSIGFDLYIFKDHVIYSSPFFVPQDEELDISPDENDDAMVIEEDDISEDEDDDHEVYNLFMFFPVIIIILLWGRIY